MSQIHRPMPPCFLRLLISLRRAKAASNFESQSLALMKQVEQRRGNASFSCTFCRMIGSRCRCSSLNSACGQNALHSETCTVAKKIRFLLLCFKRNPYRQFFSWPRPGIFLPRCFITTCGILFGSPVSEEAAASAFNLIVGGIAELPGTWDGAVLDPLGRLV